MSSSLRKTRKALFAALAYLGLASSLGSCDVKEYCIDCFDATVPTGDGGDGSDAALEDAGPPPDACVISGIEQCDGIDNDCNGEIDDGEMSGVGIECGEDVGICQAGTTVCEDGEIICGNGAISPGFELCNNLDDDCDGDTDENNPEGGLVCGSNQGECQAGVSQCTNGSIECIGEVTGGNESCNGLDDDCDGMFDENITLGGDCGPATDEGLCTIGTETCVGGSVQCMGAVFPELERCDNMDHDCDGDNTNGFNLMTDVQNCMACGNVCMGANAFMGCNSGCFIAACESDYYDHDGQVANGCEFGPCSFQGAEICNGVDDDCDGDVDENVDDNAPACDQDGECAGATASCVNGAYECNYGNTVSLDGNGEIMPEADCDDRDNDCDGNTDEAFANKGAVCDDGELGTCRDTGTMVCNANEDGVECSAVDDPTDDPPPPEICNNLDDDCDGVIDNGDLQEWVEITGGVEVFKYEASRPDSTNSEAGFVNDASVCSEQGRLPWTNVTQPDAEAACQRIGARLCTEAEWQLSCETDNIAPLVQQGSNGLIVFEAENASIRTLTAGGGENWTDFDVSDTGASGDIAVAVPDETVGDETNSNNLNGAPRMDFSIDFVETGVHYLWVRMASTGGDSDSMWFAFNDTDYSLAGSPQLDVDDHNVWLWMSVYNDETTRATFNVPSAGTHTLSFYHRQDGLFIDKILITTDENYIPVNTGPIDSCQWAYEDDCRVYQENTCNGDDFDADNSTPGNQDLVIPTGSLAACFAEWEAGGDIFDLSGNIKEWTAERAAGVNPIRGGSFNNTANGMSCQFDFLTADDTFFLPNIGFRCCR